MYGYHGRILDVDLGSGDLRVEERGEDWCGAIRRRLLARTS